MDVCDEKATVLSRSMMIKSKDHPLECDGFSCGQRDLFSALASCASLIDFVISETVFQPSFQTPALAALPFFFCMRDVTLARAT